MGPCVPPYGDCNASEGCETNLNTDTQNCGTCGTTCTVTDGIADCVGGECVPLIHATPGLTTATGVMQTGVKQIQTVIHLIAGGVGLHVPYPMAAQHVIMEYVPSHHVIPGMLTVMVLHQMVVKQT